MLLRAVACEQRTGKDINQRPGAIKVLCNSLAPWAWKGKAMVFSRSGMNEQANEFWRLGAERAGECVLAHGAEVATEGGLVVDASVERSASSPDECGLSYSG